MTLRPSLLAVAACGLLLAGVGAAGAQELQAGQTITQSEADRLEALEADMDRRDAEEADRERRHTERERRRDREDADRNRRIDEVYRRQRDDAEWTEAEQAEMDALSRAMDELEANNRREEERLNAERDAHCRAEVDGQKGMMIEQARQQYGLMIRQLRANPSSGTAQAVAGLERARDAAIAAISGQECQNDDDLLAPLTPQDDGDLLAPLTPRR